MPIIIRSKKKNNQRIARKLLRQGHVTVHHKHFNAHPIYEIRRQKIPSKEGYRHRATLRHGILKTFGTAPPLRQQRADKDGQSA